MQEPIDQFSNIQALVKLEIQNAIDIFASQAKYTVAQIPAHEHTGTDSSNISFNNLTDRLIILNPRMFGSTATIAVDYGVVFIAPFSCVLLSAQETHYQKGTDGSPVTLIIEKLTGTTAPGSGTAMTSAIDLKGNINTTVSFTLVNDLSVLNLSKGDRVSLKTSGTLTSVAGVCITILLTY